MTRLLYCLLSLGILLLASTAAENLFAQLVPPGVGPGETYHLVFVTSIETGIGPNTSVPPVDFPVFGGVPAADWIVTNAAFNAGMHTGWNGSAIVYKALLSTNSVFAIDHVDLQGPTYNLNGELLATSEADFFDASLDAFINYDEFGSEVDEFSLVWTGSFASGTSTGNNCGAWEDPNNGLGTIGTTRFADGRALAAGLRGCNDLNRLFGVSPPLTAPIAGDFNDDGNVNGVDLAAWQATFGTQVANPFNGADGDGDSDIDGADFFIWQRQYGLGPTVWTNPAGGSFEVAGNWTNDVPAGLASAELPLATTTPITLGDNHSMKDLTVSAPGDLELALGGNDLHVTKRLSLLFDEASPGSLTLSGGGSLTAAESHINSGAHLRVTDGVSAELDAVFPGDADRDRTTLLEVEGAGSQLLVDDIRREDLKFDLAVRDGGMVTLASDESGFFDFPEIESLTMENGATVTLTGGFRLPELDGFQSGTLTLVGGEIFSGFGPLSGPDGGNLPVFELTQGTAVTGGTITVGDTAGEGGIIKIQTGSSLRIVSSLAELQLGDVAGSTGTVEVDDGTIEMTNPTGNLYVGREGTGVLTVSGGGSVTSIAAMSVGRFAGSDGTVTIDGGTIDTSTTDRDVDLGNAGVGTLTITGGGTLTLGDDLQLGRSTGSGEVTLNDGTLSTGASVDGGDVLVGNGGQGTFTQNGGLLEIDDDLVVANLAGSQGTYTLTGGNISIGDNLTVANGGNGVFNQSGGQLEVSGETSLAFGTGSEATYQLTGGTFDSTTGMYVGGRSTGARGTATLTIDGSGSLNVGDALKIWSTGTVNLEGGTLTADTIENFSGGQFNFTGGQLNVTSEFIGPLLQQGGKHHVGGIDTMGLQSMSDDYFFNAGSLAIEWGGQDLGDLLAIVGSADILSGALLEVSLVDGFVPIAGDSIPFLAADGGVSGSFTGTNIIFPELPAGLTATVTNSGFGLNLSIIASASTAVPEPQSIAMALMAFYYALGCTRISCSKRT